MQTNQSTINLLPDALKDAVRLRDSITDADSNDHGRIVLSGSHGGIYPAAVASQANVRAVIFNDAGIGLGGAGVAGVDALAQVGMAAASVDCHSARIGSAADQLASGVISHVNQPAAQLGIAVQMPVSKALVRLIDAPQPPAQLDAIAEARWQFTEPSSGLQLLCVDSASLVCADDADRIIITGSHGGLIGGDPARALKALARLAVFNDAGVGKEAVGISRLAALDTAGVAAVTVSSQSAAIGSAQSCLDTGVISHSNTLAQSSGFQVGALLIDGLMQLGHHPG